MSLELSHDFVELITSNITRLKMDGLDHDFFINPNTNLKESNGVLNTIIGLSPEQLKGRWDTPKGKSILIQWKSNSFRREILNDLVGKYYDHTDLRGITLAREKLQNVDLTYVDLFSANLEGASFERCDFTQSWLSETNIAGARFEWTKMDSVLIDNVKFDHRTNFIAVSMKDIDFSHASLLQDFIIGKQRIEHLERSHPYFSKLLKWTCDYGRSFRRFLLWCIGIVSLYSSIYYFSGTIMATDLFGCVYFSVAIFTTLGHDDIHQISTMGKILVMTEVSLGYVMLGLLVAIFSKRMMVV